MICLISSAAAVAKAINVLSEYYSSAAFVQVHTADDPADLGREVPSVSIRCCADGQRNREVDERDMGKTKDLTEARGAWET